MSTSPPGLVDDREARSDGVLAAVPADGPGCSAAAAEQGRVVWANARGLADVAAGTPLTTDTRFDIASVSKQFTATAVLLLSFDGALAVTDPLSAHVAGLPAWADRVSIDQLIHHTSGIPDYDLMLTQRGIPITTPTTQQDALDVIAGVTDLKFEPGSTHEYSNSNYLLLAEVVKSASGQPLGQFLAGRVFEPLHLDMAVQPGDRAADVAVGYQQLNQQLSPVDPQWQQVGDGAVITTPTELARWGDNYRTGQVGGPQLLAAITDGSVATASDPQAPRYGAGVYLLPNGFIGHHGGWGGHLTVLTISPDRRTTLAASCNRDDDQDMWQNLLGGLHDIWFTD
ncbi:MAG TPA: serine hydrolase domain-containing protein [Microlunatus sp.]|nr:serine hydrolase domain-containing protein [Microlunatus sp.]